ncbi:hypothetical protein [Salmonirosea aquatica]|uniref:hypothetical protein n=1 Tax=Salmonirosea aquatica TaxID=2654236 RepID=UPI003570B391
MEFVQKGGKLMLFGPADHASPQFLDFLNLQNEAPLEGEFEIKSSMKGDVLERGYPHRINHRALFGGGGVRTSLKDRSDASTTLLVQLEQAGKTRDVVWVRSRPEWGGGKVAYLRGTNSSSFTGGRLLTPDDPEKWFIGPLHLRYLLPEFGLGHLVEKQDPSLKNPVLTISRSHNAFLFSGYNPSSTVRQHFKFQQGAPLLLGLETKLEKGNSTYTMPTAWNRECRAFVEQNEGIVTFRELHSGQKGITKRYSIEGLQNATVRIYPEDHVTEEQFHTYVNATYPWKTGQVPFKRGDDALGKHYVVENVTGSLVVSW